MNAATDPNLPLIESAHTLISEGRLAEAAILLNQARAQIPGDPRVFMMAGLMAEKAGNAAGAFHLMEQGLSKAPNWAPGIVELAKLQARQGQFGEAKDNAATALELEPDNLVVLEGAIDVAHLTGMRELAVQHLRQCLSQQPENTKWRLLLATDLSQLDRHDEALGLWDELIANNPQDPQALMGRVHTLLAAGRLEDAARDTGTLLALAPGNPVYAYYDARAHGQTPAHQPAELNRLLFDTEADIFDQQLVQGLRYRLPGQVAKQILAAYPDKRLNLLDLGCGTGLLGAQLGKLQGRMVGVDVSPRMLEQARRHGVYDHLEVADLHDTLRAAETASCDVIAALDVAVYVGEMHDAIASAWRVLVPGGRMVFSCESGPEDGPDLHLNPATERYMHRRSHVEALCRSAGFDTSAEDITLRYQKGQPVSGFVVTAHKAA